MTFYSLEMRPQSIIYGFIGFLKDSEPQHFSYITSAEQEDAPSVKEHHQRHTQLGYQRSLFPAHLI